MSRDLLEKLFWHGVDAVRGRAAVKKQLEASKPDAPHKIIAVGKAACDMVLGARDIFGASIPTLIVTKYGHVDASLQDDGACDIHEAAHPIPDANSLVGGAKVFEAVKAMGADERLLLLVSGGASALVEHLIDGMTLKQLQVKNESFMAQGLSIGEINAERKKFSLVKGGGLLNNFGGAACDVIAISDVEGDSVDVIASGIGASHGTGEHVRIAIAGSNAVARQAVADNADLTIAANDECLYGEVDRIANIVMEKIEAGPSGLYIFGGEPTVYLPENPGRGGRNQDLALRLADKIRGRDDATILVAGTDGTDGPTDDAGAIVDGNTVSGDIASYLTRADAGTYLAKRGALLTTGPTGTNVMDLVLAIKG